MDKISSNLSQFASIDIPDFSRNPQDALKQKSRQSLALQGNFNFYRSMGTINASQIAGKQNMKKIPKKASPELINRV
jgi:hypothetical protein